ncbi:MAG: hypothetical protein KC800_23765 [Candidatus Eremiobacteraeota bacterium]|nr:hypothetical protein [Candidatus Eremiobacteraeota bacterium]
MEVGEGRTMRRVWVPLVLLAVPILGPALSTLFVGGVPALFFEQLFFKSLTLYVLSVVAWMVVAHIVPRIEPPSKTAKSLLVGGLVSFPIFVVGLFLWLEAVDINSLKNNATVSSVGELKTQWERPWGERHLGIFAHGTLRAPAEGAEPEVLTHYGYRKGDSTTFFPLTLPLVFPNGEEVEISCVQQVAGAVNWPEADRAFSVGLKEGDPVVVWGEPAKFEAVGSGAESYGLGQVKVIVYGQPSELETALVEPARRAARPVGWMALVMALLSWIPLAASWRISRRTA